MPFRRPILMLLLCCTLCISSSTIEPEINSIKIEWVKNLVGDFGFHYEWSYKEGIYLNEYGELVCDGLCPSELEGMVDSYGKILKDSLNQYYSILDTTHQIHTLEGDAWSYEYSGTDFITFWQKDSKEIVGKSTCTIATHCSLEIMIIGNQCTPKLILNGVNSEKKHVFPLKEGEIKIDPFYFKKGVIKADFDFNFINTINPNQPLYWKGKIFSAILQP